MNFNHLPVCEKIYHARFISLKLFISFVFDGTPDEF